MEVAEHDVAFCPNSFDKFHSLKTLDEFKTAKPAKVSSKAHSSVDGEQSGKPPSTHSVRGEEPSDEMRRKGLGEEPRLAFGAGCKHAGQKLNDIYVIELFAGTARLTKCLRKQGFQAMAFDRTSKRSEGQHILEADLSNREEVEALLSFLRLKADFIAFVHMAPPCGTASRARGKRLKFLRSHNIKEPMPLRDDRFPDGFHWLSGSDKLRTEAANILYENTVLIAQTAIDLSIAICIENPSSSLMWKTSPFQRFFATNPNLRFINFHNCAHGGTRDKKTCFVTSVDWFDKLEIYCDKQHAHAPWHPTVVDGRVNFPTHAEAAYPEILCNRIASMLKHALVTQGAIEVTNLEDQVKNHGKSLNRVVLGALPRGKHAKPLVSEFGAYINVVQAPQQDSGLHDLLHQLPKGAAIQSRLLSTWGEVREAVERQTKKRMLENKLEQLKSCSQVGSTKVSDPYQETYVKFGCEHGSTYKFLGVSSEEKSSEDVCEKVVIAIPREPMDFMCRAVEAGHPRSVAIHLPPVLQEVVQWNRDAKTFDVYRHRIDFVKRWTERAKVLTSADATVLAQAPPHLQSLLHNKRLALWQEMLDFYEYPDKELVRDITRGFPVTGWLPDSQVFPKDYKPPSMSVQTLHSLSKGLNERVKAKLGSSNADFLGEATWEETEKELQEGWMEVDLEGGKDAAWAMRFGLQQRDKIRVIDDFSIAGVNHTAGLQERLKIFGIDDIAALIAFSMDTFEGEVHPALLGKTMDLKSAYKQFGICVEDRQRIRVATRKPTTSEIVLLMVNALPFGATGSVSGFLRVSMFLWFLGVVGLRLAWTSFYDDYTMISREDCASNAAWSAECLFELLGILYAKEGKKATTFDRIFGSLGVIFDLSEISCGTISLVHTESRRSELVATIEEMLREQSFTAKGVERLRGRLLWYENFVCGRQANVLVASLSKFINGVKHTQNMSDELVVTLKLLLDRVRAGKPIVVSRKLFSTWVCFTDGACENKASMGAVLIGPAGNAFGYFGGEFPEELQSHFYRESKHPIYEVELLPTLVTIIVWKEVLQSCQIVF